MGKSERRSSESKESRVCPKLRLTLSSICGPQSELRVSLQHPHLDCLSVNSGAFSLLFQDGDSCLPVTVSLRTHPRTNKKKLSCLLLFVGVVLVVAWQPCMLANKYACGQCQQPMTQSYHPANHLPPLLSDSITNISS